MGVLLSQREVKAISEQLGATNPFMSINLVITLSMYTVVSTIFSAVVSLVCACVNVYACKINITQWACFILFTNMYLNWTCRFKYNNLVASNTIKSGKCIYMFVYEKFSYPHIYMYIYMYTYVFHVDGTLLVI